MICPRQMSQSRVQLAGSWTRGETPWTRPITTRDGTTIYYKDWGQGQPIVFHHGWPLCADDWDSQMLFFLEGYRVIAHDRRGHGRSTQTATGNDMDTYAADVDSLVEHLDLRDAIHVGHSTGGGEVARRLCGSLSAKGRAGLAEGGAAEFGAAGHGQERQEPRRDADRGVRRLPRRDGEPRPVLPGCRLRPVLRFQPTGRDGVPGRRLQLVATGHDGWDQGPLRLHQGLLRDRLHRGPAAHPGSDPGDARRGRPGSCCSRTSAPLSAKLLPNATTKFYPGFPHGMPTVHADVINADLLAFIKS